MTFALPGQTQFIKLGEFHVSGDPALVLSTVLGSCVAVCLWDPVRKIGGMNHFLLPHSPDATSEDLPRYGVNAMELLFNGLFRLGSLRKDLRAKVFGGARLNGSLTDIGKSNASFAKQFLADEQIPCVADSLGGTQARRILFRPATGQVSQLLVHDTDRASTGTNQPAQ